MVTIRREQLDAFAVSALSSFEARMIDHLESIFPDWSAARGPSNLRAFVRHGISRARAHGFEVELDVARYLHVMQELGERFDESPDHPWAAELLARTIPSQEKMDCLRDACEYQLEARRIGHGR